jgi:hypothetical protein
MEQAAIVSRQLSPVAPQLLLCFGAKRHRFRSDRPENRGHSRCRGGTRDPASRGRCCPHYDRTHRRPLGLKPTLSAAPRARSGSPRPRAHRLADRLGRRRIPVSIPNASWLSPANANEGRCMEKTAEGTNRSQRTTFMSVGPSGIQQTKPLEEREGR